MFCLFVLILDRVGWIQIPCLSKNDLESLVLLSLPPQCHHTYILADELAVIRQHYSDSKSKHPNLLTGTKCEHGNFIFHKFVARINVVKTISPSHWFKQEFSCIPEQQDSDSCVT